MKLILTLKQVQLNGDMNKKEVKNQIILSPYFIDEPLPELESLARPHWLLNKIDLPAGSKMVFEHLNRSGKLAAVSVSTWNPRLDTDGKSRKVCMQLLDTLLSN